MDDLNTEQSVPKRRWSRRRGRVILLIILLLGTASPFLLRAYTDLRFRDATYTIDDVPARKVVIVFGAKVERNGRPSTMLRDRVATAADLYFAGKVEQILMTGDNREANYNEPEAMRQYALRLGIPDEVIILDPLGVRTYDSCYRAFHLFEIDEAILVTQNFHLDRALLLCNAIGMDVVGVWADYHHPNGYGGSAERANKLREIPATVLAVWDIVGRPIPDTTQS